MLRYVTLAILGYIYYITLHIESYELWNCIPKPGHLLLQTCRSRVTPFLSFITVYASFAERKIWFLFILYSFITYTSYPLHICVYVRACVRVCIYKNNILNQTFEKIRNFLSFLSSQFSRELIIYTILEEFFIPIKKGGSINTQVATS